MVRKLQDEQSWVNTAVAAPAPGSRHTASVQIHATQWMCLPPTEVGTRRWGLCCIAIQKPEPPCLRLLVETAEVPPLSPFHLPSMTFTSAVAETGPHVISEEVWEMEALALHPLACSRGEGGGVLWATNDISLGIILSWKLLY